MLSLLRNARKNKLRRGAQARQAHRMRPVFESFEPRMLLSTTLAEWTFETSVPTSVGPHSAEVSGVSTDSEVNAAWAADSKASAYHANTSAAYSNPAGNGSVESFSSDNWSVGDYYQFTTSTIGYEGITFSFDQTGSNTGPRDFQVQYSTDGTNFTVLAGYTLTNDSWGSGTNKPASHRSYTITSSDLNDQAIIYIRLVDVGTTAINGSPVQSGGTGRVDNVKIEAATKIANTQKVGFSANSYTVNEDAGTVTVRVNRSAANDTDRSGTQTVLFSTSNGTALDGTHYTSVSQILTFNPGDEYIDVVVPINAIHPIAGDSTFTVTLSNLTFAGGTAGVEAALGISTATVTIQSTESIVSLTGSHYSISDAGGNGNAVFSILRSGSLDNEVTVQYTISGAFSSTAITGTVTFAAGASVATFTTPLVDVTGHQDFTVTISKLSVEDPLVVLGSQVTATGTLIDTGSSELTNNLSGQSNDAAYTTSIEVNGSYNSTYAPVVGDSTAGSGPFSYLSYQVLQFSTSLTSGLYPEAGYTVTSLDNLTLQLFNTDTDGTYGGHVGNFNLYLLTTSTSTVALKYNTAFSSGISDQDAILLGTFSFDNTYGYSRYVLNNLSPEVSDMLIAALNSGADFRLAVTPSATGVGAIAADWGTLSAPVLSLSAGVEQVYQVETFNFDNASYSVDRINANSVQITVTRDGTSDEAWVNYATVNGSAIGGVDYTVTSGTLYFAVGESTATFTVNVASNLSVYGNKSFQVVLSDPDDATGHGFVHVLGTQNTAVIKIEDSRTVDVSQSAGQSLTVQRSQVYSNNSYLNVEGLGNGTDGSYASFGVIQYNTYDINGENPLYFTLPEGYDIGNINTLTLSLITAGPNPASWLANGTINVYLTLDLSATIDPILSGLRFQASDPEGVNGQLGSLYLLGTMSYSKTQSLSEFTDFVLSDFDETTKQLLINALTDGTGFRLVLTPGDDAVAASFEGMFTPEGGSLQSPKLTFNLSPVQTEVQLPSYITASQDAVYTWDNTTGELHLTSGTLTFTGDSAGAVNLSVDGANSSVVFNTTQHLAGLTLTNGATATVAENGNNVLVVNAASFAIDSSSSLDLTNNAAILKNGGSSALNTVQSLITNAANGLAWDGTGITSSNAANDAFGHALGYVLNSDLENFGVGFSSLNGETVGSDDVIIRYTTQGDANLDGVTTDEDYGYVDLFLDTTYSTWLWGDFDYDGITSANDYAYIDLNVIS